MQHGGWRPAIHRRKISGALLIAILSATAVIGVLRAQLPGTATEVVLYSFKGPLHGANPQTGVVRDRAGNLYGTTYNGGAAGQGVVFRVDTTGHETVLHSFTGGAGGGNPVTGVIGDSAGNLYGTAGGGTANAGVVYQLDATGHETVLHTFTGGSDGGSPSSGVIRDSAGNLYGTTGSGGAANAGVVYKLDATGHETVLYSFSGGADGGNPVAGVIGDSAGNLFGTTYYGGTANAGVVYKLDPAGHETVLYTFRDGPDGGYPSSGVIRDSAGNLYGTTAGGGHNDCTPISCFCNPDGCGVLFKIDTVGQETVLYTFYNGTLSPSGVIRDRVGNLYGTGSGVPGTGTVYKVDATGHFTVLYTFAGGAGGRGPSSGVIGDGAGNLFGTALGGTATLGVVYKLDPTGHETVLYSFPAGADGYNPQAGVIGDGAGNLYGTTAYGGTGYGVVFKLDPSGHETVLHSFTGGSDGGYPYSAGVIRDSAGNLYGTTYSGGITTGAAVCANGGCGVVFKLDTAGQETVLHAFAGSSDGANPYGSLIGDSAGNLYGTTYNNGSNSGAAIAGVVYKLDTTGHEIVLYSFTGRSDGGFPQAGVIRDSAGNLYGTASAGGITMGPCGGPYLGLGCGVVYKIDPTGHETVLYSFTGGTDGANPYAGLIGDSAGNLYGTTTAGGGITNGVCAPRGCGVVYKIDPTGHETVLHSFTGGADGGYPQAGVIRDSAGNLYGTTANGGPANAGVVYKLDPTGHETVLYSFTGGADGGSPSGTLIPDSAGNLYGTTFLGGPANAGVVYRIKP
jgi:uncharacterized repeat protein (TIGR03803 family)